MTSPDSRADAHQRGATADHADFAGELTRTVSGDQEVAQTRRPNDLDSTGFHNEERHVGLAGRDQDFPAG